MKDVGAALLTLRAQSRSSEARFTETSRCLAPVFAALVGETFISDSSIFDNAAGSGFEDGGGVGAGTGPHLMVRSSWYPAQ